MIFRRIGWAIVVAWFVVTATFAMVVAIPSDPARAMLGAQATPEMLDRVNEHYCLDRGFVVQYGCYLDNVIHGDLGVSYRTKRPVVDILAERLWPTLQLVLATLLLQVVVGIPLGVLAAARRNRWPDRTVGVIGLIGQSAPSFFVGTVLLYVFAYRLGWFPITGYGNGGLDRLWHLVLPAMTLATVGVAYYSRIARTEMIDALGEDYVRTARAKGVPESRVVTRHALRNALGPLVTMFGLDLGALLGATVVTESIFAWPGIGRESVLAILEADMPLIIGVVTVSALAIALANLLADLVNRWLDPRLR